MQKDEGEGEYHERTNHERTIAREKKEGRTKLELRFCLVVNGMERKQRDLFVTRGVEEFGGNHCAEIPT